jgi:hypothetical protein
MIVCLCCFGCTDAKIPAAESGLVVEGWIENGRHPVVIVTTSVPTTTEYQDWESLYDHLVRWAKVTISDGEQSVVLTGKYSDDYFPPYIYTTARIMGEVGKTYWLTVEYEDMVATAVTTVPEPVELEYVKVKEVEAGYKIVAGIRDDKTVKNYYRFFTMVEGVDSTYAPSLLGLIDDAVLTEDVNEAFVNGQYMAMTDSIKRPPTQYLKDDVVRIRFSNMDEQAFNYWTDYDDIASLAASPFFPVNKKIRSNVSSGMGCWAGYGSSYYRVSIADSLAQGRVLPMEP